MDITNHKKQTIYVDGINFDDELSIDDELVITMYEGNLHFQSMIAEEEIPRLIELLEKLLEDDEVK